MATNRPTTWVWNGKHLRSMICEEWSEWRHKWHDAGWMVKKGYQGTSNNAWQQKIIKTKRHSRLVNRKMEMCKRPSKHFEGRTRKTHSLWKYLITKHKQKLNSTENMQYYARKHCEWFCVAPARICSGSWACALVQSCACMCKATENQNTL